MTQFNSVKVKLSNSQLKKSNSRIENGTTVTLNLSSNVIGDSNGDTNFPHKWLLIDRQVARLRKTFAINSSVNVKLSITQLFKMVQWVGSLGRLSH